MSFHGVRHTVLRILDGMPTAEVFPSMSAAQALTSSGLTVFMTFIIASWGTGSSAAGGGGFLGGASPYLVWGEREGEGKVKIIELTFSRDFFFRRRDFPSDILGR